MRFRLPIVGTYRCLFLVVAIIALASVVTAQQPAPKPELQPIDPAIRADVEHYFAHTAPGELLLKKQQWKQLSKDLETLKQLPAAPPATTAALIPQP